MQGLCLRPAVCVEGRGVYPFICARGRGVYGGQKQQQLGDSRRDQKEEREGM